MDSEFCASVYDWLKVYSPVVDIFVLLQVEDTAHILFLFQMIDVFNFLGLGTHDQILGYQCVVHS